MYSLEEQKFLLSLARQSIEFYLLNEEMLEIRESSIPSEALLEARACFVTLTLAGQLRGCIGHITPTQRLYLDVVDNAVSSAFEDRRFSPLTSKDLEQVEIEISVLTLPKPLFFSSQEDLLAKLRPGVDGIILKYGRNQATFLPQVWDELSKKEEFLSQLCLKAGLANDAWRKPGLEVATYEVEAFKENAQE